MGVGRLRRIDARRESTVCQLRFDPVREALRWVAVSGYARRDSDHRLELECRRGTFLVRLWLLSSASVLSSTSHRSRTLT